MLQRHKTDEPSVVWPESTDLPPPDDRENRHRVGDLLLRWYVGPQSRRCPDSSVRVEVGGVD